MKLSRNSLFFIGITLCLFLSGCIRDYLDDDECVEGGGLTVTLYSQSPCQTDSVLPDFVYDIVVAVFDENNVLVSHHLDSEIVLTKDFSTQMNLLSGSYSVVVWTGIIDDPYVVTYDLENGITHKNDLLFHIDRSRKIAEAINKRIYYGEASVTHTEEVSRRFEYTKIGVNLLEVTNRFTVEMEGLSDHVEDYEIVMESDNGAMYINGRIADDELITYEPVVVIADGIIHAQFTLLKIDRSHINTLIIRNKIDGTELFRGDLLEALLLKNPQLDLNCDHDFTLHFLFDEAYDTITKIWVNNWLVHSHNTEL